AVALDLHGRVLFGAGMTYKHLEALLRSGATVERLEATEGDPVGAFRARFGPEAIPLLVAEEGGDVVPVTAAPLPDARAPRAVIGLAPPAGRRGGGAAGA